MDRVTGALFVEGRFGTDERNAVSIFKRSIIYILCITCLMLSCHQHFSLSLKGLKVPGF